MRNRRLYLFDTGKSYFQSFELPVVRTPYRITVESYLLGDEIDRAYVFFPHVLILDKDHKVVRTAGKELFELKKTGMTETWVFNINCQPALRSRKRIEMSDTSLS